MENSSPIFTELTPVSLTAPEPTTTTDAPTTTEATTTTEAPTTSAAIPEPPKTPKTPKLPKKIPPGRLKDELKETISTVNRKLTISQKKDVIRVHLKNPSLGNIKLKARVKVELGWTLSKESIRKILRNQHKIMNTESSEETTRTHYLPDGVMRFRQRLNNVIIAESYHLGISNNIIKDYARMLQEREFKDDSDVQALRFSNDWVNAFKKDFSIRYRKISGKKYLINDAECEVSLRELRSLMSNFLFSFLTLKKSYAKGIMLLRVSFMQRPGHYGNRVCNELHWAFSLPRSNS